MRKIIYIIVLVMMAIPSYGAVSLTQQADSAYNKDNYAEALRIYNEIATKEGTSSNLFYNMGNTYFRMGNKGMAILFYERALQLDPRNDDAKTNLNFVNSKIVDKTEALESNILAEIIQTIVGTQSSNGWAVTSALLFILSLGALMLYMFSTTILYRKIGFFGGLTILLFTILSLAASFSVRNRITESKYAIVISPSITLSTSPRLPKDKSEEAFILNEGTKVSVIDSVENKTNQGVIEKWYDVKADDSHRAWVEKKNIKII